MVVHAYSTGVSVRCVRAREGQAIPCFFPLAGWSGGPLDVVGPTWSCSPGGSGGWTQELSASSARVGPLEVHYGLSVRCVRAREGQAVPLFWIVGFLGSLNYEGLAGVQGIRSRCRRSVSGLFSNPPAAVMASGNTPSAALTAPVGNTFRLACR